MANNSLSVHMNKVLSVVIKCCEVFCIFLTYFCSKVLQIDSMMNPLEEEENDTNQDISIMQYKLKEI